MDAGCSLIIFQDNKKNQTSASDIIKAVESKDVTKVKQALMDAIIAITNGEDMDRILMTVIRFCVHSEDHEVKKLLALYWEVVNKYGSDGVLKEEMILVCSALQDDLRHPNEYIRGATLRFLCRISESEIISPLIVPIKENLEHRHPYVRRYAVMCVFHIYQNFGDTLIPDAPNLIMTLIEQETDISTRRNAFLMLYTTSKNLAIQYMMDNLERVTQFGDGVQILCMQLIRKTCEEDPSYSTKFIKILLYLLNNFNNTVALEASSTLLFLSTSPTNVRAACETMIQILHTETDYNIKLIILNRLDYLRKTYIRVLRPFVIDILREINSQSEDILMKVLEITVGLVSTKNIEEIIDILKNRLIELTDAKNQTNSQKLIVQTIHQCTSKFPETAHNIVLTLMNFLNDKGVSGIMEFVKEVLLLYPESRLEIINKLLHLLGNIVDHDVFESAFWSIGKYSVTTKDQIEKSLQSFLPLIKDKDFSPSFQDCIKTESVLSCFVVCITRLLLQYYKFVGETKETSKTFAIEISLYICEILSTGLTMQIEKERIEFCLQLILDPKLRELFETEFMVTAENSEVKKPSQILENLVEPKDVDCLISFRQLKGNRSLGMTDIDIDDTATINRISLQSKSKKELQKLIYPFTGLGDPVYIETQLSIHDFDILLTIYIFNRTDDTLTDINLNLCCKGNLKLVERPSLYTIEPFGSTQVKASLKIESTESSCIFGSFNYTPSSRAGSIYLNLNTVHIDVMNYIFPGECTHISFREMWSIFEWENRVVVQTHITDLFQYLENIIKITNSKCLTPLTQKSDSIQFLAANLYAKTIFNEHALFNVCVAYTDTGITGYIRIRSKTQGIALSLGERITSKQDSLQ